MATQEVNLVLLPPMQTKRLQGTHRYTQWASAVTYFYKWTLTLHWPEMFFPG